MDDWKKIGERRAERHTYGIYRRDRTTTEAEYHVRDEDAGQTVAGSFGSREEAYEWIEGRRKEGRDRSRSDHAFHSIYQDARAHTRSGTLRKLFGG